MKTRNRFLLHTLLPPPMGATVILIAMAVIEPHKDHDWPRILVGSVIVAYIFAIVPSLVYAALMELGYRRGLAPGRGGAMVLSALLGLLAGSLRFLGEGYTSSWKRLLGLGIWPVAGLLTGLLIEWWIGCLIRRRPLTPSSSAPSRTSPPP